MIVSPRMTPRRPLAVMVVALALLVPTGGGLARADGLEATDLPGAELAQPEADVKAALDAALDGFAEGRMTIESRRYYVMDAQIPPVAAMKRVDSELAGRAQRIADMGPDPTVITYYSWREMTGFLRRRPGDQVLVLAFPHGRYGDPVIYAVATGTRLAGWPPGTGGYAGGSPAASAP